MLLISTLSNKIQQYNLYAGMNVAHESYLAAKKKSLYNMLFNIPQAAWDSLVLFQHSVLTFSSCKTHSSICSLLVSVQLSLCLH